MKYYLYNPLSNNGIRPQFKEGVEPIEVVGLDYQKFFDELKEDDEVVLMGGDGTLNYFINALDTEKIKQNVYLLPTGTGNDFLHDIGGKPGEEVLINKYLKNLPTSYVNGKEVKFINGIGYGIDGYVCEVAEDIKKKTPNAKINYTTIAIKGLLFKFKQKEATIIVDGKEYKHEHVWLAPSMKGRFYGGGMMIAPTQDRNSDELSLVILKCPSKLRTLAIFPSIFKGEHIKNEKIVTIYKGKEIEVRFSSPCTVQIDGEIILDVTSYKAKI